MRLLLVGISHRTAPVELREQLDFQAQGVDVALRALSERTSVKEAIVLSTCNRAEVYAACDALEPARKDDRRLHLRVSRHRPLDRVAPHLRQQRPRRGAPSVPGLGRPRFDGRRRAADSRTGQGRARGGQRGPNRRTGARTGCFTRRSAPASGYGPRPGWAPARCRSASPRSPWPARSSAISKAATCW